MNCKQRRAAAKSGQILNAPRVDSVIMGAAELLTAGIRHHQAGRLAEAEACYRQVLASHPGQPEASHLLGVLAHQAGRSGLAIELIGQAIKRNKRNPDFHSDLGIVLHAQGRFAEALASYDKALALKPGHAGALHNRGNPLLKLGRFEEALASYDKALALRPDFAEAYNGRGNALQKLARFEEAVASYDKALALKPGYAEALSNRGNALRELERFAEALECCERALALRPLFVDAVNNRGVVLQDMSRFDEALAAKARALIANIGKKGAFIQPFALLGYSGDPSLQLRCAKNFAAYMFPSLPRPVWTGETWRHDKIRIAYLSADFHEHATAYLMAELFERHDRSRFEITAVSFGIDDGSEMRKRLAAAFDRFADVRQKTDEEAAVLLRDLQIDVAIDLKGYTGDCRPGILAYRPAPIQVSYLGYPGTMGAPFIDYIIADGTVAPFEHQAFYTEKIVHLPHCYQVNDTKRVIAQRTPTRQEAGLPEEGFVFCCFNQSWKITPSVFGVWMRLLHAVDGSVLWLLRKSETKEHNLRNEAQARGIDPTRLVFARRLPPEDHLARHRLADLFLDTLPFNAHTTTSDALWAGLPVVTQQGEAFAGRVAASLLNAIGLPELIMQNSVDYEALALRLARDAALLEGYRQRLNANRLTYPLFDTDRFRRHIETAYLQMWETWQRGELPRSFKVEAEGVCVPQ